jgi:hypothetical protein
MKQRSGELAEATTMQEREGEQEQQERECGRVAVRPESGERRGGRAEAVDGQCKQGRLSEVLPSLTLALAIF